jgi:hypothetical protein
MNATQRISETNAIAQKIHRILERGICFFSFFIFSSRLFIFKNAFSQN